MSGIIKTLRRIWRFILKVLATFSFVKDIILIAVVIGLVAANFQLWFVFLSAGVVSFILHFLAYNVAR